MPALHNYPVTVIFPREDEMTTIWSGPRPPAEPNPPAWSLRGVRKRISVPIIPSLRYSSIFDAEKVVEELESYRDCGIGLVGMGFISASFYKYVTEHLSAAKFVEVTDEVDTIKAVKSEEEIRYIRETCEMQDAALKKEGANSLCLKNRGEIESPAQHPFFFARRRGGPAPPS